MKGAGRIERNRRALDELGRLRRYTSPVLWGLERTLERRLRDSAHGALLDVGCGSMPYRSVVGSLVTSHDGLDVDRRSHDVRYVASATDMSPVPDASYDTVLCTEVLEHVDEPWRAVREMARVLRPGGTLVLSVPFLARLHEEPRDFFRYTSHGIRNMLEGAGFAVLSLESHGSVGSFLGHQVSSILLGLTWHIPVVRWLVFAVNALAVVAPARLLDLVLGTRGELLTTGYVVVAVSGDA